MKRFAAKILKRYILASKPFEEVAKCFIICLILDLDKAFVL